MSPRMTSLPLIGAYLIAGGAAAGVDQVERATRATAVEQRPGLGLPYRLYIILPMDNTSATKRRPFKLGDRVRCLEAGDRPATVIDTGGRGVNVHVLFDDGAVEWWPKASCDLVKRHSPSLVPATQSTG